MTKVETLVYEYEHCIDCRNCTLNHYLITKHEYTWACELTGKRLDCVRIMEAKIPRWCPLPDKPILEETQLIGQTADYDFNMTPPYIERDR